MVGNLTWNDGKVSKYVRTISYGLTSDVPKKIFFWILDYVRVEDLFDLIRYELKTGKAESCMSNNVESVEYTKNGSVLSAISITENRE